MRSGPSLDRAFGISIIVRVRGGQESGSSGCCSGCRDRALLEVALAQDSENRIIVRGSEAPGGRHPLDLVAYLVQQHPVLRPGTRKIEQLFGIGVDSGA